jgi:hypothetical protein
LFPKFPHFKPFKDGPFRSRVLSRERTRANCPQLFSGKNRFPQNLQNFLNSSLPFSAIGSVKTRKTKHLKANKKIMPRQRLELHFAFIVIDLILLTQNTKSVKKEVIFG